MKVKKIIRDWLVTEKEICPLNCQNLWAVIDIIENKAMTFNRFLYRLNVNGLGEIAEIVKSHYKPF